VSVPGWQSVRLCWVRRNGPDEGEPVPVLLRFQLDQATHPEMDYLRLLVARDQQRREPVEEGQVADQRERLVFAHPT